MATDVIDVITDEIRPRRGLLNIGESLQSKEWKDIVDLAKYHSGDWEYHLQRSFWEQWTKASLGEQEEVTVLFVSRYVLHLREFTPWHAFGARLGLHLSNRLPFLMARAYLQLPEQASESAAPDTALPNAGNSPPAEAGLALNGPNTVGSDRRAAVNAYIEEVLIKTGKRITRTDIWKVAGDVSRAEFERWESYWYEKHDKKPNRAADLRFTRILTQKPHLK